MSQEQRESSTSPRVPPATVFTTIERQDSSTLLVSQVPSLSWTIPRPAFLRQSSSSQLPYMCQSTSSNSSNSNSNSNSNDSSSNNKYKSKPKAERESSHSATVDGDGESQPASYLTNVTTLSENYNDSSITPSSNSSTQSGTSGCLLLTAANLAALRLEQSAPGYHGKGNKLDTASLASSTHFTLVNGMERWRRKPVQKCWCENHQLTALVTAMSIILSITVLICIYLAEMKINESSRFS